MLPATMVSRYEESDSHRLRRSFLLTGAFVVLLWFLKGIELLSGLDFSHYGVYPLRPEGLIGILLGPLIHGSVSHLFSNTLPLLILGTTLLYGYPRSARLVLPALYIGSGIGVWLFARSSWHIGASGLTFGMLSFIFTIGALRWDKRAIVLAMVVFFFYGGMLWGILPVDPSISFESHLAGAVLGMLLAFLLKHHDPMPPEKHYSWEYEEGTDGDAAPPDRPDSQPPESRHMTSSSGCVIATAPR